MREKIVFQILQQVENDYNSIASDFSQTRHHPWPEFAHFSKYIKKGDRILDIGCGNGRLVNFLEKFEINYLGMDKAEKLILEAKRKFPKYQFQQGDILNIAANEKFFDKVFCIAVLHHLPNEKLRLKALAEIKRVLKQDGILILTVWDLFQPKYECYFRKAFWKSVFSFGQYSCRDFFIPWGQEKKVTRYYYAFKFDELKKLLMKAGFEILEEIKEGFNFCVIAKPINEAEILGVKIDMVTNKQALDKIRQFLKSEKQYYGVTPNPEIILAAQKDKQFQDILNKADFKIADGIGLLWAAWLMSSVESCLSADRCRVSNYKGIIKKIYVTYKAFAGLIVLLIYPKFLKKILQERLSGTDLMIEICREIPAKVFLLGAGEGVAEEAKRKMEEKGFKAKFVGTYSGSPEEEGIIERINKGKPEVLFVAFGAPNQEKWIAKNLIKMPSLKFAMGVGGAFDFISEKVKRAPLLFRKLGLEWLWRLIKQPWRIKRIYNAVIKFPLEVIKSKFI